MTSATTTRMSDSRTSEGVMRAVVQDGYGPIERLRLDEAERPAIGDSGVLIRVEAAGVDAGIWHLVTGQPYLVRLSGFGVLKPRHVVPGSDVAGTVEAVGAAVAEFRPGDAVFGTADGAFAEYTVTSASRLTRIPDGLSFAEAGALPTSGMAALQALRDGAEVQPGQQVLVIGAAGGVGTFAVQIAKWLGAEVTGVCSTSKVPLVRSIGADAVIDYTQEDFTERDGRYDVILDLAGNRPLRRLRRALTPHGTLVLVGGDGNRLIGGAGRLVRAAMLSPFVGQRLKPFFSTPSLEDLRELTRMVELGAVRPVLDRTFPLADAAEALRHVHAGGAQGKSVLEVFGGASTAS